VQVAPPSETVIVTLPVGVGPPEVTRNSTGKAEPEVEGSGASLVIVVVVEMDLTSMSLEVALA
jgi:hypothetical protein